MAVLGTLAARALTLWTTFLTKARFGSHFRQVMVVETTIVRMAVMKIETTALLQTPGQALTHHPYLICIWMSAVIWFCQATPFRTWLPHRRQRSLLIWV
jgi:hypothetical protein